MTSELKSCGRRGGNCQCTSVEECVYHGERSSAGSEDATELLVLADMIGAISGRTSREDDRVSLILAGTQLRRFAGTFTDAQSVGMREALEDIWALTSSFSQYTLEHFARKVRSKVDAALASQPSPAATVEMKPFYGAECPSYPNCKGGCGLGCTHEVEQRKRSSAGNDGARAALDKLADKVAAKINQLQYYRDNDCQLDHAKTIAEGRLQQANQILHWIADAAVSHTSEPQTAGDWHAGYREGMRDARNIQTTFGSRPVRCPNGLEHGACLHPDCVPSCPGRLALTRPVLCTCSPLTNYTDSPHEPSCPLASDHLLGEK